MKVLGLDISTKTIGIAVIDGMKLVHYEYYRPKKLVKPKAIEEISRNIAARDHIIKIADGYGVERVAIEDFIKFMSGGSAASTIIPLAVLNRTICTGLYDKGLDLDILNIMRIRNTIKLNTKPPSKEEVPDTVAKHLQLKEFPFITGRFGKVQVECYDMADGMAVAIASLILRPN